MKTGKSPACSRVSKQPFERLVFAVSGPQAIAMSNQVTLTGMHHLDGIGMHLHAQLIGEVAPGPHVVVSQVPMDVESAVDQLCQFAQKTHRAFRDDMTPLKPKVDEVTYQMKGIALTAHFFEPCQEHPFALP